MLRSLPTRTLASKLSSSLKPTTITPSILSLLRRASTSTTSNTTSPSSPSLLSNPRTMVSSTTSPLTEARLPSSTRPLSSVAPPTSSSTESTENWTPSTHPSHPTLPFSTFSLPLEQSPLDDRQYKLIRLANGLEALLIRDEKTDKSTAAMDVKVGHLMDPDNLQGCAHFCEHLLFLGTEKFPRENEYSEFLAANGGHSNAFTGMENTNYYFDVSPPSLLPALERFSQFFVAPLFTPSCTERELKAVDSEHSKNLQSDMWRMYQLEKSLTKPGHPYGKFGTGNWNTLWEEVKKDGREPRDELLKWWNGSYDAGRMKLVVLGKDSLDDLTGWVVDLFSPVPNKGLPPVTVFDSDPFGPTVQATTTFVKTVKDIQSLELAWVIPDQETLYRSKPASFLSHYIGHEGPGSILSYLKKKGWVNSLSAGPSEGATGWGFLRISCDLTPEGLENYEQISTAIFSYLGLLAKSGPQPAAFEEVQSLATLNFQFAEKSSSPSDYASDLASQLSGPWPKEWTLSQPWLMRGFDAEKVKETLECLTVEKCKLTVASQELPKAVAERGTWDRKEAVYGTEFRVEKFSQEFLDAAAKAVSLKEFALPEPNQFIPKDVHVDKIEGVEPVEVPALVRENEISQLWYKKDDRFWVPRANFWVGMKNPILDSSALNAASARLFTDLFRDHMTEKVYDAELAGLRCQIMYSGGSIILSAMGYNDKLPALLETAVLELKNYKVDPERFELLKDDLRRDWSNHELGEPYNLSNYYGYYLTEDVMYPPKEKLAEFEKITVESIQKLATEALSRLHILTLVHGNMSKEAAVELQQVVEDTLKPAPLTEKEKESELSLYLPEASQHVWNFPLPNKANPNSGVEYYCQVGSSTSDSLRPLASLFSQIAREPCFDTLRTKEQLGYLVSSGGRSHSGTVGFHILVQSQNDSNYLENRIEAFLVTLEKTIEEMSEEEFEKQKQSLIDNKLQKVKNLYEESSRLWRHIQDGYFDFQRREKDVATLRTITKSDLLSFFLSYIHPSSPTRRKTSVHLKTQYVGPLFNPASAQPIVQTMMENGIPLRMDQFGALMASNPPPGVGQIQAFANECIEQAGESVDKAVKEDLLKRIKELGVDEGEKKVGVLKEGNVLIEGDVREWKRSLEKTEPARPIVALDTFRIK
ncbi:Metalloenzyme, LuxS/M16 peptidase-like protein [Mrakia frigida]|uniref:Metalloenzyme, LuxS/M16 peptidase-like protein n=1 Tax=Mrakia frigida TaxID=29902 RepID=UPI003FCC0B6A